MTDAKPPRWSKIDEIEIGGYPHLEPCDLCFYYLERSHGTWEKSEANRMVSNFQKDIEQYHDRPEVMRYKYDAIEFFADRVCEIIAKKQRLCPLVVVPMITSKPKKHRWHDDRLTRTAHAIASKRPGEVVVCDVLDVDESFLKAKRGGKRDPREISSHIISAAPDHPQARVVFLIDDVITTGGHFAACKKAVQPLFPEAQIVGIFLARQKLGYEYGFTEFPK